MTSEELELHLADLYEWLSEHGELLRASLEAIREEGVSRYPILMVLAAEVNMSQSGGLVWLPTRGAAWRAACTTAEQAAHRGWLAAERVDSFLSLYREHPTSSACVFLVLPQQQQWIFVDMQRLEQSVLLSSSIDEEMIEGSLQKG